MVNKIWIETIILTLIRWAIISNSYVLIHHSLISIKTYLKIFPLLVSFKCCTSSESVNCKVQTAIISLCNIFHTSGGNESLGVRWLTDCHWETVLEHEHGPSGHHHHHHPPGHTPGYCGPRRKAVRRSWQFIIVKLVSYDYFGKGSIKK